MATMTFGIKVLFMLFAGIAAKRITNEDATKISSGTGADSATKDLRMYVISNSHFREAGVHVKLLRFTKDDEGLVKTTKEETLGEAVTDGYGQAEFKGVPIDVELAAEYSPPGSFCSHGLKKLGTLLDYCGKDKVLTDSCSFQLVIMTNIYAQAQCCELPCSEYQYVGDAWITDHFDPTKLYEVGVMAGTPGMTVEMGWFDDKYGSPPDYFVMLEKHVTGDTTNSKEGDEGRARFEKVPYNQEVIFREGPGCTPVKYRMADKCSVERGILHCPQVEVPACTTLQKMRNKAQNVGNKIWGLLG